MIVPDPWQREHGWEIEKIPWLSASTPVPLQTGQSCGEVPGFAPVPWQVGHAWEVGTDSDTWLPLTAGRIQVAGRDVELEPLAVRRALGYLPEHNALYENMRVDRFLLFIGRMHGLDQGRLEEQLEWVGRKCDLQAVLGKRIRLRYTPELDFKYDDTAARAGRIEALLKEDKKDNEPSS